MKRVSRKGQFLVLALVVASATGLSGATTITLDVDPGSALIGGWLPGDLVEITIRAASDGDATQGVHAADFKTGDWAITVLDPTKLKIHDVWGNHPILGFSQIDAELDALITDMMDPAYAAAEDTWVHDDFTDFVGSVDMAETTFQAVATAKVASGTALGTGGSPVDFLHVVLEIQPGFGEGDLASVEFYGQVSAYNTTELDTTSIVFGTLDGAVNRGSFDIQIAPEPSAMIVLLGAVVLTRRRRRR